MQIFSGKFYKNNIYSYIEIKTKCALYMCILEYWFFRCNISLSFALNFYTTCNFVLLIKPEKSQFK